MKIPFGNELTNRTPKEFRNIMAKEKQNKSYIEITLMGKSDSGKTNVWYVRNKSDPENDIPGIIKWSGAWRKYVYHTHPSFYDANCLREIADFIEHQMEMRKTQKGLHI